MFKRILLIGDNSRVRNWGCRGTTASLKKLIAEKFPGAEIRSIYWHSYRWDTPANGWPAPDPAATRTEPAPSMMGRALSKLGLHPLAAALHRKIRRSGPPGAANRDSVPLTAEQFESAANEMLAGRMLPHEMQLLNWCDAVIINGEGSIYPGSGRFARYPLFLMYVIKKYLNKPCSMVNHTIEAENEDIEAMVRLVYPLLDYIAVREPWSARELHRIGIERDIPVVPDALFSFQPKADWHPSEELQLEVDFSRPFLCLGDSSGLFRVSWDIPAVYRALVENLRNICGQVVFVDGNGEYSRKFKGMASEAGIGQVNVDNCSYEDLYHVLGHAELYISGRWHPSILCAMAGTPLVLMGANSHKTQGLLELFDYPGKIFDLARLPWATEGLLAEAKRILSMRESLGEMLRGKSRDFAAAAERNIRFSYD